MMVVASKPRTWKVGERGLYIQGFKAILFFFFKEGRWRRKRRRKHTRDVAC